MEVHVQATGTRPLLMHNVRLASPLDPYAKQIKEISAKRNKTEDDREAIAKIEFQGGLYFDENLGPYIPGTMILACLNDGAKVTRSGKKVERGVEPSELINPLAYIGPRTREGLWENPDFVDVRSVKVVTARVDRTRPIFREWQLDFDLYVDPDILSFDEVSRIVDDAGRLSGIGDYRKMYGRFKSTIELVHP